MSRLRRYGRWADAHIHLDLYEEHEREPLLRRAFGEGGIAAVVAVSMHLGSCETNRRLARLHPGRVHPAYGFHPEQPLPPEAELDALVAWIEARAAEGEAFAVGEVGLPYYARTEAEEAGRRFDEAPYAALLERFVRLAAKLGRPIVLHAVYEDAAKACDLLERYGVRRAHFHWFKGPEATVRRMIANGYAVSVTPDVLYEAEIRELVRAYPLGLLMTETDGPWPFEGPFAGRRTAPEMTRRVAEEIAAVKGLPVPEVEERLLANALTFYGLS
ncbi:TatD family hydrolase [Paenibacillus sp. MWE-103]|uniref:TatD family hydrolase n=1 Tax=Paenibacillus artemisiicola TaxID=1172618 RepID=A0ABS3W767_9BACL|nr:TatD family hydrolase [Paenibacillus artemisiicola]MBO7744147.1 TatD family hydrolase [Paenibacillus artemisiicola]